MICISEVVPAKNEADNAGVSKYDRHESLWGGMVGLPCVLAGAGG